MSIHWSDYEFNEEREIPYWLFLWILILSFLLDVLLYMGGFYAICLVGGYL